MAKLEITIEVKDIQESKSILESISKHWTVSHAHLSLLDMLNGELVSNNNSAQQKTPVNDTKVSEVQNVQKEPVSTTSKSSQENSLVGEEPIINMGSKVFGEKKSKDMKPSEFLAFGQEGKDYLKWMIERFEEILATVEDPKKTEPVKKLLPWIKKAYLS